MLPLISVVLLVLGALGIKRLLPGIRKHRRQVCFSDLMSCRNIFRGCRACVFCIAPRIVGQQRSLYARFRMSWLKLSLRTFPSAIWRCGMVTRPKCSHSPSYIISVCRQLTSIPTDKFAGVKRDAEVGKFTLYER
jgi:hypothetical protein